jgi:hypothetical protein
VAEAADSSSSKLYKFELDLGAQIDEFKSKSGDYSIALLLGKLGPVFRIHDILGWIRIRGSILLTNGSGSGFGRILDPDPDSSGTWIRIQLFSSFIFKMPTKN